MASEQEERERLRYLQLKAKAGQGTAQAEAELGGAAPAAKPGTGGYAKDVVRQAAPQTYSSLRELAYSKEPYWKKATVGAGKVAFSALGDIASYPNRALAGPATMAEPGARPFRGQLETLAEKGVPGQVASSAIGTVADPTTWFGLGLGAKAVQAASPAARAAAQLKTAQQAVQKVAAKSSKQLAREATASIGPLTRGQDAAAIAGSATPSNAWARIEKVISSIPGGAGVMAKFKGKQMEAAVSGLKKITGGELDNVTDDIAKKVADAVELSYSQDKAAFREAYSQAIKAGKVSLVDGEKAANKLTKKFANSSAYTNLAAKDKGMVDGFIERLRGIREKAIIENVPGESQIVESGYRKGMAKAVLGEEPKRAGKVASNYEAYRYLQSDVIAAKKQLQNQIFQGTANASEAQRAISVLDDMKKTLKAQEYLHLRILGGNELVDALKLVDNLYASERGPLQAIKKVFGIGKEVGEKGFVESGQALDRLLDPKKSQQFDMVIGHLADDTRQSIKQGLIQKVVRPSINTRTVEGIGTIPTSIKVETFRRNLNKYKPLLKKLSTPDEMKYLDDYMNYLDRAQIKDIAFDNAANKSGTGFITTIIGLTGLGSAGGGAILGGSSLGVPMAGAVPVAMGTSRALAKIATRQKFDALDKALFIYAPAIVAGAGIVATTNK